MSDELATLNDVRREVRDAVLEEIETWRQEAQEVFSWPERVERKYAHLDRDAVRDVVLQTLALIDHEVRATSLVPE